MAGPSARPSPPPPPAARQEQRPPAHAPRPPPPGAKDERPPHAASSASPSSDEEQQQTSRTQPQPQPQPREPLLRIRVLAVERRGKELNVRLDAATNLAPFRHSHYPPFLRSYRELTFFALSLSVHVPSHILAALPLPPPLFSASPSPQADSRVLCHALSRWFSRLAAEPAHRDHPETRNFIEADYSYHPIPPHVDYAPLLLQKRWRAVMDHAASVERGISIDLGAGLGLPSGVLSTPATPTRGGGGFLGFGGAKSSSSTVPGGKGLSLSRNVHDEDEDLVAARMEVTRLELQFSEAANKGFKVVEARAKVTEQLAALSNKLHTFAGVEDTRQLTSDMGLPTDLRKLADGLPAVDLTQQATSHTETTTLLYQLTYQSSNARAAKEALLARNALVEEHHEATKRTLLKKREIEALKARMGTGGVSRDRIEICIEEFAEASRYTNALRQDLARLSKSMHGSLKNHSRNAHADLQAALAEHARGTIFHLKKDIQALKGLRADIRGDTKTSRESEATDQMALSQSNTSAKSIGDVIESQRASKSEVGDASFDALAKSDETRREEEDRVGDKLDNMSDQQSGSTLEQSEGTLEQGEGTLEQGEGTLEQGEGTLEQGEGTLEHDTLDTTGPGEERTPTAATIVEGSRSPTHPSEESKLAVHASVQDPTKSSSSPLLARPPPVSNPWTNGSFESTSQHWSVNDPLPEVSPASSAVWSRPETDSGMTQSLYHPPPPAVGPQQSAGAEGTMSGSGLLSRSDAGFGSSRGGGTAAMRGRGRISASEAARSLAGRF